MRSRTHQPISMKNVFQIYEELKTVPFAASRQNWGDDDIIVITKIEPIGKYGKAWGFPARNGIPNDHFAYSSWKKDMELPNVGSYQWRMIQMDDSRLNELILKFYEGIGRKFGFSDPEEGVDREDEWINGMLGFGDD